MAIQELPTRTDLSVYDFTLELDGEVFTIAMTFNRRCNHWYMSLFDADGVAVREGIKLVANWSLLLTWVQQGRPEGGMIAVNPGNDNDPDRDTLGTECVLTYDEGNDFG